MLTLALVRHVYVTVILQRGQIPGDFAIMWTAGLAAHRDVDMYDPTLAKALALEAVGELRSGWYSVPLWSSTHPPSELPLTWLLAFLPWPAASTLWSTFLQLCYFAVIGMLLWLMRRQAAGPIAQWGFAILATLYIPAQFSIEIGQVDIPLLALMLLALVLSQRGRRFISGMPLGVAACIKPTPALLLILFVLRRDWRAIAGAAASAVLLVLASLALAGVAPWITWTTVVLPELLRGSTILNNQTFNGLGYHLFVDSSLLTSLAPPPSIPMAGAIAAILNVAFLGALVVIGWRYARVGSGVSFQIVFALFVIYSLVGSSISWDYYYTWALFPLALALVPAARVFHSPRPWLWATVYAVAYGLLLIPHRFFVLDMPLYENWWPLRLTLQVRIYGALLLAALLVRGLRSEGKNGKQRD